MGARVADPDRVAKLVAAASRQTAHPASVHWRDHAVGQGHAGLALLFGALDQHDPGQGWDRTAHRHLTLAARAIEAVPRPPAGLFAGLAGLGLVATVLSDDGARYRRLLATLDQALVARVPALVNALERRAGGSAVRELDLISGLAGIAAYLLLRREEPGVGAALHEVLGSLVELTGSDEDGPRWRTRPDQLGPDERARYPNGYLNCGLAHGIPGPLAVLSLALRVGPGLPGLPDAVARTADWLTAHRTDGPSGPNWPNAVSLGRTVAYPVAPARSAWCYGGPGVAAALRLAGNALRGASAGLRDPAGEALGDAAAGHQDLAVVALSAALARPAEVARVDSPTFCHGRAGLLAITSTFARATGDDGFRRAAATMAAELVDRFDPAAPLGYRDTESGGRVIDQPGLLTGAPGVALALLGATSPVEPAWARLFLLA
ncbi:MAG TPA: lanthionine synthetase C family protein [Actinomycetota bacterium]